MTSTWHTNDEVEVDAGRLIELLWQGWVKLLDRYDGRTTAEADPIERMRILYELHAKALLLCSVPAPDHHTLGRKAVVAAWLQDHARDAWSGLMAEAAITADTEVLQPANALPA